MTENNGVYTKYVPVLWGDFKIGGADWEVDNSDWGGFVGEGAAGANMEIGREYDCAAKGSDMSMAYSVYGATVTFNLTSHRIKIEGIRIPTRLYILGNVAQDATVHKFVANKGVEMTCKSNTGSNAVFEAKNVLFGDYNDPENGYTEASYFSFSENLGSTADDWQSLGFRFGATAKDLKVELGTSMALLQSEYPAAPNAFAITPGVYNVTVDLGNRTMTVSEAYQLPKVTTLSALDDVTDGEIVDFTGTVFCEFNYLGDDDISTLYMSQNGMQGKQFIFSPSFANVNVAFLQPAKFNRGQTLKEFQVRKYNGKYTIVGLTLNDYKLPQTTTATEQSVEIPRMLSSTNLDNYINKIVQVYGRIDTEHMTVKMDNSTTTFTLTNPFTNGPQPGKTMAKTAINAQWLYGYPLPNIYDELGYVAGILSKDGENYSLAMTTVSMDDPITGVETKEIDADAIVDVYNMQGIVVRREVKYGEATRSLPAGLYIVAGKKVIVR